MFYLDVEEAGVKKAYFIEDYIQNVFKKQVFMEDS